MSASEWQYDALNRVTQQRDAGSGWIILTLDQAENPTTALTSRRKSITATFDAINRVTQRVVPAVVYVRLDRAPPKGPSPHTRTLRFHR